MRNRPKLPGARRAARGFTLLEILVAFTLMAMIVAVLMRVFSGGLQGISRAEDYARATSIAESALARVGADIPFKEGDTNGEEGDRYRWTLSIKAQSEQAGLNAAGQPQPIMPVRLFEVSVVVGWTDYGTTRQVALSSLRLGART